MYHSSPQMVPLRYAPLHISGEMDRDKMTQQLGILKVSMFDIMYLAFITIFLT